MLASTKVDNDGKTPLLTACVDGDKDMVLVLLAMGVDVNKTDKRGITLFRGCVYGRSLEKSQRVEKNGAIIKK